MREGNSIVLIVETGGSIQKTDRDSRIYFGMWIKHSNQNFTKGTVEFK